MSKWQKFWDSYRNDHALSEADLFIQVGKTVARQPISRVMFQHMVQRIVDSLQLGQNDHVLDLCCGNGLISFELAAVAKQVTGVDFARHLISGAQAFKSRSNISYRVADVTLPLSELVGETDGLPDKLLMNDALAYFEPGTLAVIVDNVCDALDGRAFRFLLTGIPSSALKWNFYDTPERKRRYQENLQAGDSTNDGLGRWWTTDEIEALAISRGLSVRVEDQPEGISNYRMDALIWRD
ncbi:class I SAM-dependent methyltransferase [Luteimonas sp. SMYT11W]|uniref:Class I SAM-dependent methyltransferase n=1 Tax=Luteimonas flava TaxID=3115822 RepID=A0ABU7WIN3_9GAMM